MEQLAAMWHAWLAARNAQADDLGDHMIAWHERWLWPSLAQIGAAFASCANGEHTERRSPPVTNLDALKAAKAHAAE